MYDIFVVVLACAAALSVLTLLMRFFFIPVMSFKPVTVGSASKSLYYDHWKPNWVSSQANPANRRAFVAPLSNTSLDEIDALLATWPDMTLVTSDGPYRHYTSKTKIMGYIDDVEFKASEEGGIHVRSASRLGLRDYGANRKRVEAIRAALASSF